MVVCRHIFITDDDSISLAHSSVFLIVYNACPDCVRMT